MSMSKKLGKSSKRRSRKSKSKKSQGKTGTYGYTTFPPKLVKNLPATLLTRMTYSDYRDIDAPLGLTASYVYRLTSPFDPDFTGVGGQSTPFDQIIAIYREGYVYRCDIEIDVQNNDTTANQICGYNITGTNSAVSTDPNVLIRNGQPESAILLGPRGSTGDHWKWNLTVYPKQYHDYYGSDNSQRFTESNGPTQNVYLALWTAANNASVNPSSVALYVKLVMWCKMSSATVTPNS